MLGEEMTSGSEMDYHIGDLLAKDSSRIAQVAELLLLAFKDLSPDSWPDFESAFAEVRESFEPGRISRVAIDSNGDILGWVGGISHYAGKAWELHPIVVHPDHQGKRIGTALVRDLIKQVSSRGGATLWLGTDDETNRTSIAGKDLYPDVLAQLSRLCNIHGHPFEFFQKVGFSIVGVIPDANGIGKPDILMAMRVSQ
jgi:aminoglycoside 6'-N-acetyltransferase I